MGRDLISTHPSTPVAIFCIERVPCLDGLLVRCVLLPSLFGRLTCAGVAKRKPFLRRRQRSQCGLFIGAFFRRCLAHQCKDWANWNLIEICLAGLFGSRPLLFLLSISHQTRGRLMGPRTPTGALRKPRYTSPRGFRWYTRQSWLHPIDEF
jgi:hypothetical protein